MANKTNRIIIRLNDLDLAVIKQKAELSQMSVSEYMRTAATQRKVDGYNKAAVSVPEPQIRGQIEITDIIPEEPEETPKRGRKGAKKA